MGECRLLGVTILNRVVKEVLVEKITFAQRSEGGEGASQVAIWGKKFPGHENTVCQDSEVPDQFREQQEDQL